MGLRPTQGNEKRLGPASTLYGTVTLSLSSRPERSGAEGPAVPQTLRGDVFRQSVAEWRDLRFSFRFSNDSAQSEPDQQFNLEPLRLNGLQSKIRSTPLLPSQSCA
jgi:hypothetical protein